MLILLIVFPNDVTMKTILLVTLFSFLQGNILGLFTEKVQKGSFDPGMCGKVVSMAESAVQEADDSMGETIDKIPTVAKMHNFDKSDGELSHAGRSHESKSKDSDVGKDKAVNRHAVSKDEGKKKGKNKDIKENKEVKHENEKTQKNKDRHEAEEWKESKEKETRKTKESNVNKEQLSNKEKLKIKDSKANREKSSNKETKKEEKVKNESKFQESNGKTGQTIWSFDADNKDSQSQNLSVSGVDDNLVNGLFGNKSIAGNVSSKLEGMQLYLDTFCRCIY